MTFTCIVVDRVTSSVTHCQQFCHSLSWFEYALQAHQAHSVPYFPSVWCQHGWDCILLVRNDSSHEKIDHQTSVFYCILSRWRNWQVERDVQLLLGCLLLPRLWGRGLRGPSKNGRAVIILKIVVLICTRQIQDDLLTNVFFSSGEGRLHHLLCDGINTSPGVLHHWLLLRRRFLCHLINPKFPWI